MSVETSEGRGRRERWQTGQECMLSGEKEKAFLGLRERWEVKEHEWLSVRGMCLCVCGGDQPLCDCLMDRLR